MADFSVSGKIVDILARRIYSGTIHVKQGKISDIVEESVSNEHYILPGFVDAHIHVESSALVPSEFARLAVIHGTVGTVSDPHEIANVLGIEGVRYMIRNSKKVPLNITFGASPCVPATTFETAGGVLSPEDIRDLFEIDELKYLSEMMNFPGVLTHSPDVMKKIAIAKELGKPIDGHSPGLTGKEANQYIHEGISTDHECYTLQEAQFKLEHGMKVIIREGSAAKNFEALHPLITLFPNQLMFCCDDLDPDELYISHINEIVKRALSLHYDLFDVLRIASYNPIKHYGLDIGLLQKGDSADFIITNNLSGLKVKSTYIKGEKVAENGHSLIKHSPTEIINLFNCLPKKTEDFIIRAKEASIDVIEAIPGQLITNHLKLPAKIEEGNYVSDTQNDIIKIAVVNRYHNAPPAISFIKGFGLSKGAIASSVAHDSHNIIAIGVDDSSLCQAVNAIIEQKGGICVVKNGETSILPLPVAGLMSDQDGFEVAKQYATIKKKAIRMCKNVPAPFITLSFMALLVIPSLKLSDLGLFDGTKFQFVK